MTGFKLSSKQTICALAGGVLLAGFVAAGACLADKCERSSQERAAARTMFSDFGRILLSAKKVSQEPLAAGSCVYALGKDPKGGAVALCIEDTQDSLTVAECPVRRSDSGVWVLAGGERTYRLFLQEGDKLTRHALNESAGYKEEIASIGGLLTREISSLDRQDEVVAKMDAACRKTLSRLQNEQVEGRLALK